MSLLETKVLPKLDGEYTVRVKAYDEIENEKGGYIRTILVLPDREYPFNIFPSSVDYVARNLRNQLGVADKEVTLAELLDLAMTKDFKVWFSYNAEYNSMNVALHNSVAVTEEAPDLE